MGSCVFLWDSGLMNDRYKGHNKCVFSDVGCSHFTKTLLYWTLWTITVETVIVSLVVACTC